MKNILIPFFIISFFLFIWCILSPCIDTWVKGKFTIIELNFPKKDSLYIMPKGSQLLYNSITKQYIVKVQDKKWPNLKNELRIEVYSMGGLNSDIWSTCDDENKTTFKDSSIAKYYAHLWYDNQYGSGTFKPLTK